MPLKYMITTKIWLEPFIIWTLKAPSGHRLLYHSVTMRAQVSLMLVGIVAMRHRISNSFPSEQASDPASYGLHLRDAVVHSPVNCLPGRARDPVRNWALILYAADLSKPFSVFVRFVGTTFLFWLGSVEHSPSGISSRFESAIP